YRIDPPRTCSRHHLFLVHHLQEQGRAQRLQPLPRTHLRRRPSAAKLPGHRPCGRCPTPRQL
ncbi:hypothetical protein BGZ54_002058, partial [Gamsiella multidivaricata]